jgi:hypothetical protein
MTEEQPPVKPNGNRRGSQSGGLGGEFVPGSGSSFWLLISDF